MNLRGGTCSRYGCLFLKFLSRKKVGKPWGCTLCPCWMFGQEGCRFAALMGGLRTRLRIGNLKLRSSCWGTERLRNPTLTSSCSCRVDRPCLLTSWPRIKRWGQRLGGKKRAVVILWFITWKSWKKRLTVVRLLRFVLAVAIFPVWDCMVVRWCRLSGARLVPSSWSAGDVLGVLEKANFGTPGHFPPFVPSLCLCFWRVWCRAVWVSGSCCIAQCSASSRSPWSINCVPPRCFIGKQSGKVAKTQLGEKDEEVSTNTQKREASPMGHGGNGSPWDHLPVPRKVSTRSWILVGVDLVAIHFLRRLVIWCVVLTWKICVLTGLTSWARPWESWFWANQKTSWSIQTLLCISSDWWCESGWW